MWTNILILASIIISIYGCIKFNVGIFLSIFLFFAAPIAVILLSVSIDVIKIVLVSIYTNSKCQKLSKKIKTYIKDDRYIFICRILDKANVAIKMVNLESEDEDIYIHIEDRAIKEIPRIVSFMKKDIERTRNKQIYEILHNISEDEVINICMGLLNDMYSEIQDSTLDKGLGLEKIKTKLTELKSIDREVLPNLKKPLNTYYEILTNCSESKDEEFLDMVYKENTYVLENCSEGVSIISTYIIAKIYDFDNNEFKS